MNALINRASGTGSPVSTIERYDLKSIVNIVNDLYKNGYNLVLHLREGDRINNELEPDIKNVIYTAFRYGIPVVYEPMSKG